ncbi:hypothetical protein [Xanthomonas nasturtii]|nr:hypothetical protein [Xanthomonas nasturtii]MCL1557382.1 hypothetical protein [Xanthomonas nasturtii]
MALTMGINRHGLPEVAPGGSVRDVGAVGPLIPIEHLQQRSPGNPGFLCGHGLGCLTNLDPVLKKPKKRQNK